MIATTFAVLGVSLSFGFSEAPRPIDYQPRLAPVVSPVLQIRLVERPEELLRVWVFFTDKNVRNETDRQERLAQRAVELPARTQHRRQLRRTAAGLVDARDLAPVRSYVDAVRATGAKIRHESRWLNGVSADATPGQIAQLERLSFVRRIQPVARAARRRPMPETPVSETAPRGDPSWYNNSYNQLAQINVVGAHDAGYTGAGVVVGILDTGFNRTHTAFNQSTGGAHPVQIIAEYDFVDSDGNTAQEGGDPGGQSDHGTYILGVLGAFHPNVLVGAAYDAEFLLAKTEDISQEVPAEEDNYVAGLEWLELNGADMATSSLGYIDWYTQADLDGQTAVTTVAVNIATANGMVCCTAAGNEGHDADQGTSHLIAPSDAYEVITCGAVDSAGTSAWFTSDGPSADGRVKPEVVARGVSTMTVTSSNNTSIVGVNGTSLSTPLVAGGVALILQAHPDWTADKVRRALFHTSDIFLATFYFDFEYVQGYGIIDVDAAIQFIHSDIDGDGLADGNDVQHFVDSLMGINQDLDELRRSDINADGLPDAADVPIFVNDLLGL
ncbi:MAG TPA: S8 family serine peptidase [Phycisphaerae bacterium]|nr:S8 family serine peptidase [Phycisphaerae bacterium]